MKSDSLLILFLYRKENKEKQKKKEEKKEEKAVRHM
jgi:hypothetical protein